jgi:MSHA biogenesis protein MshN
MSVINQLLIDLEKRRASAPERGQLPNHVRALPEREPAAVPWGWIAAAVAAVLAAAAAFWAFLPGIEWSRQRAVASPVAPPGAERAIERVVAASAGVATDALTAEGGWEGRREPVVASRMSLDLSNPPASAAREEAPRDPLPASRVLGRMPPEPIAAREAPPEPARSGDTVALLKAPPAAPVAVAKSEIQRQERQPTLRERAEAEFGKATAWLHQGRHAEAQEGFQAALAHDPGHHGARQALVGMMLDAGRLGEAERLLQEGLALAPAQSGFAMTLARLQVDRGETAQAIVTLGNGLEHARGNADYVAFLAALQQRMGRHEAAIELFQAALRLRPASGVWWLGLGVSLQAVHRNADAQDAYRRARASNNLSPELAAFADQRLRQLQ